MIISYDRECGVLYMEGHGPCHVREMEEYIHTLLHCIGDYTGLPSKLCGIEDLFSEDRWPFGEEGYDAETDVRTVGETTDEPDRITVNGDLVGYWGNPDWAPDQLAPIGVSVRRASKYFGPLRLAFSNSPDEPGQKELGYVCILSNQCPVSACRSIASRKMEGHVIVSYDKDVDVLHLSIGHAFRAQWLEYQGSVRALMLGYPAEFPCELAGLDITGASRYWPLGEEGYDAETDVLTLGTTVDAKQITEDDIVVGYWGEGPDDYVPIGISIRRASRYLAPLGLVVSNPPEEFNHVCIEYSEYPEGHFSAPLGPDESEHSSHEDLEPVDLSTLADMMMNNQEDPDE